MPETFGERVKRLRIESGYKGPQALGVAAGITRVYIHRIETGLAPRNVIGAKTLMNLSKALGVSESYLLHGEEGNE